MPFLLFPFFLAGSLFGLLLPFDRRHDRWYDLHLRLPPRL